MQFKTDNYDDIKKYYAGTFIKVKEYGDLLFRIDRVERTSVSGMVEDGREFVLYMDQDNPYEIDYVLPHKSFFQFGADACQLYRVPARQYRRGLCIDNTRIARLNSKGQQEQLGDLSFESLKAFVAKQPFYTLTKATSKENKEGLHSYVLTPRMVYHRNTKGIYIDLVRVADVDVASSTVTMKHPVFKAEIQNFLSKSNDLFTVK